jgi:hypothetical protein
MHWDWHRDFGWHAFGTRRDAFNLLPAELEAFRQRHALLSEAPTVFLGTLADTLEQIKVFTRSPGSNSFTRNHQPDNPGGGV